MTRCNVRLCNGGGIFVLSVAEKVQPLTSNSSCYER